MIPTPIDFGKKEDLVRIMTNQKKLLVTLRMYLRVMPESYCVEHDRGIK